MSIEELEYCGVDLTESERLDIMQKNIMQESLK